MSDTSFDTEVLPYLSTGNGDHERFAHYVQKEDALEGLIYGRPVIALCGKIWVPSRDPEKFPVCPTCKKLYDELGKNANS